MDIDFARQENDKVIFRMEFEIDNLEDETESDDYLLAFDIQHYFRNEEIKILAEKVMKKEAEFFKTQDFLIHSVATFLNQEFADSPKDESGIIEVLTYHLEQI